MSLMHVNFIFGRSSSASSVIASRSLFKIRRTFRRTSLIRMQTANQYISWLLKPSCCGQHDLLLLPKLCRPFRPSVLARLLAHILDGLLSKRSKHRVYGIGVGWMSG